MLPLKDLQTLFQQALLESYGPSGDVSKLEPLLSHVKSTPNLAAERRLKIYSGSVYANISEALKLTYPVIARIMGDDFQRCAYEYVRTHPSAQQNLNFYGAGFADFLTTHIDLPPYLPDLAQLEWHWDQCFFSADDPAFDLVQTLQAIAPAQYAMLRFKLSNSARLVSSVYPLKTIWLHYQVSDATSLAPQPVQAGELQGWLIWRAGFNRRIDPATPAQWQFLQQLQAGKTLAQLADVLPVDQLLPEIARQGWICGLD